MCSLIAFSTGISLLPKSAEAATVSGFGCIDNPACQSYLEVYGGGYGISFNNDTSFQEFPIVRSNSPILGSPSIPDGPRGGLSKPLSQIFEDSYGNSIGRMDGFASAQIETVLKYGQLKALALASTESQHSVAIPWISMDSRAWASTRIGWGDTIKVTASNKQQGELVPFEVRLDLDSNVIASGRRSGNTQAIVRAQFANVGILDSNYYRSTVNSVTDIINLPVGEITPISASLEVVAYSQALADYLNKLDIDYSSANALHTANYYLTPLDPDVSYTTGSGQTYFYKEDVTPLPDPQNVPEPLTIFGSLTALGFGAAMKRRFQKKTSA